MPCMYPHNPLLVAAINKEDRRHYQSKPTMLECAFALLLGSICGIIIALCI